MKCMDCGEEVITGVVKSNDLNPKSLLPSDQKKARCMECSRLRDQKR